VLLAELIYVKVSFTSSFANRGCHSLPVACCASASEECASSSGLRLHCRSGTAPTLLDQLMSMLLSFEQKRPERTILFDYQRKFLTRSGKIICNRKARSSQSLAFQNLRANGRRNWHVSCCDGSQGLPTPQQQKRMTCKTTSLNRQLMR